MGAILSFPAPLDRQARDAVFTPRPDEIAAIRVERRMKWVMFDGEWVQVPMICTLEPDGRVIAETPELGEAS